MNFAEIDRAKTACRVCPLWKNGGSVLCTGKRDKPPLMVIGEAPGTEEIVYRVPFIGPAGQIMRRALLAAGFKLDEVLFSNLLGCHPPQNAFPEDRQQVQGCIDTFLKAEIEEAKPRVILLAGAKPLFYMCGLTGITRHRGVWRDGPFNTPMMVTFHPSYLLRGAGDDAERLFQDDIKSAYQRVS